ncbi:MAG: PIN domain-containing protein [Gammaproteobacteria bacterium]|nr:PIN domain-containing protein [Gammaproteobacteria bacterium]
MIFLDTHIVVWLYAGYTNKLTQTATNAIEDNNVLISQVAKLEMQYLHEIGRVTAAPDIIIKYLSSAIGLNLATMNAEDVFDQAMKYQWTRDVFDRLITAEADITGTSLITKDRTILAHYSLAVW